MVKTFVYKVYSNLVSKNFCDYWFRI